LTAADAVIIISLNKELEPHVVAERHIFSGMGDPDQGRRIAEQTHAVAYRIAVFMTVAVHEANPV